jgi:hypothetical protein
MIQHDRFFQPVPSATILLKKLAAGNSPIPENTFPPNNANILMTLLHVDLLHGFAKNALVWCVKDVVNLIQIPCHTVFSTMMVQSHTVQFCPTPHLASIPDVPTVKKTQKDWKN